MLAVAGALVPVALADSSDTTEFVTEDATVTVTGDDYESTTTVKVIAKVYETEYIWTDNGTLTLTVITGSTELETVTTDPTDTVETERATVLALPEIAATEVLTTASPELSSGSIYSNSLSVEPLVSLAFEPLDVPVETGASSSEVSELVSVASEVPEPSEVSEVVSPTNFGNLSLVVATAELSEVLSSSEVPQLLSAPIIANSSSAVITSLSSSAEPTGVDPLATLSHPDSSSVWNNATSVGDDWTSTLSQSIPLGSYGDPFTITSTTTWQGELAVYHLVVLPTEVCDC